MNITLTIPDNQVKGLILWLQQVGGIEKPTKKDIKNELDSIVQSALQSDRSSYSDYIVN